MGSWETQAEELSHFDYSCVSFIWQIFVNHQQHARYDIRVMGKAFLMWILAQSYIYGKNTRRGKAKTLISVLIMHKEQHGRVSQKHSKQGKARRGNQRDWSPDHIGLCRILKWLWHLLLNQVGSQWWTLSAGLDWSVCFNRLLLATYVDDSCRVEAKPIWWLSWVIQTRNPGMGEGGLDEDSSIREEILDIFWIQVELMYLLMDYMWDVREKGVKNDFKVFDLSNYKSKVISYSDEEDWRRIRVGFLFACFIMFCLGMKQWWCKNQEFKF